VPITIALLLGIVEGLTEYLPVSSTGHLILTSAIVAKVTGQPRTGAGAFEIVIQFGAILAVLVHYRRLLATRAAGLVKRDPLSTRLLAALVVGFVPTAITGLLLRKLIKKLLFGPWPVAIAFVVGGVIMIGYELYRGTKADKGLQGLEHVTPKRAFYIGLGQCLAMWPGASRSMCTIVAGQLTGLSTATAAEFSFLLGLPTLGAATLYEALKSRHELMHEVGAASLVVGLVSSFLVAWAVVALFVRFLGKHGLAPFGVYRIVAAVAVYFLLVR
jgi:undecaprenyl-diphosphatase